MASSSRSSGSRPSISVTSRASSSNAAVAGHRRDSARHAAFITGLEVESVIPDGVWYCAAAGETGVTTRRHEHYRTSELDRKLIPLLDGTRDRAALAAAMADLALAGQLRVERQGRPLTDPAELRQAVGEVLDKRLEDYARLALLSG